MWFFFITKLSGGQFGHFLEIFTEEKLIAVAHLPRDFFDRIIGFDESMFGLINPLSPKPVNGAGADG
jgi:hypothetical protein